MPPLFRKPEFLLASAVFLSMPMNASGAEFSCVDSNLQEKLKPELDLSKVPEQCEISAEAPYGKTKIKTENGEKEVCCCADLRIQAYDAAKSQVDLKRELCSNTKVAAAEQACAGAAECLNNNIHLMAAGRRMNALLAENARKMRILGDRCLQRIEQVTQEVQKDVSTISKAKASTPVQDRSAFDKLRRLVKK